LAVNAAISRAAGSKTVRLYSWLLDVMGRPRTFLLLRFKPDRILINRASFCHTERPKTATQVSI
jgi:hypothetical protein